MASADVLARADADLAAGRPEVAARRLRTLLAAPPQDMAVYRRLARAYRLAGDPVEAGRWGFLSADVTDEELGAFQTAHPSPWIRLRLLRWTAGHRAVPDAEARERLRTLVAEAEREGPPADYQGPLYTGEEHGRRFSCLFVAVVLAIAAAGGTVVLVRFLELI